MRLDKGTITMPAAAADAKHPCDQGCVQALGVFLDTIVICTPDRIRRCHGKSVAHGGQRSMV